MSDRDQAIIDQYENLEEEDFLSDGVRPKVSAMEALTEIDDLSRAEIDEALADKYAELEAADEEPEEEPEAEEPDDEPEPVPAPPSEDDAASSLPCEGEKEILCVQEKKIMGGIRVIKYTDHTKKTEKLG